MMIIAIGDFIELTYIGAAILGFRSFFPFVRRKTGLQNEKKKSLQAIACAD